MLYMTVTPSIKTRLLKPFLILCLMVGALFCAPAVSAADSDVYDDIIEHFELDGSTYTYQGYIDGYWVTFNGNIKAGRLYFVANGSLSFFNYSTNQDGCSFRLRNLYTYENYTRINDISHRDGDDTFIYNHLDSNGVAFNSPFVVNNNTSPLLSINANYADWQDCGIPAEIAQYIDYNQTLPPVETDSQTYADAMLQEYLHKEGFTPEMATAWLIAPSGQPFQIPLSYTEPHNYNGDVWVQLQSFTPYLDKFTPRFSDSFNAVDYAGYKLAVSYDIDVSYVKLYALTDKQYSYDYDFNLYINDTIRQDSTSTLPQIKGYYDFDGVTYFGSLYETDNGSENDRELLFCIWDFNPTPAAAIPRFVPLYCALDVRTVDSNGDTLISRDSNDYRQFVTNYNQKAITGLTGSYTGSTFSKQDWRGQSVSQDVDYNNDFTISYDSNLGQVFSTIFSMGGGHVLTLCMGCLSIAFAAYVLFGKH